MFYFDDKLLKVGNFTKILLLSEDEISFEFKKYILTVSGNGLIMPYLEDGEVGIKGIIKNVNIKYKMVKDNV